MGYIFGYDWMGQTIESCFLGQISLLNLILWLHFGSYVWVKVMLLRLLSDFCGSRFGSNQLGHTLSKSALKLTWPTKVILKCILSEKTLVLMTNARLLRGFAVSKAALARNFYIRMNMQWGTDLWPRPYSPHFFYFFVFSSIFSFQSFQITFVDLQDHDHSSKDDFELFKTTEVIIFTWSAT